MNNSDNGVHIKKIEESFLKLINSFEDPTCMLFIKCIVCTENNKGNLNEIGKSFQKIATYLINRTQYLEFMPTEDEDHGTKVRLEQALNSINEIGKELEQMSDEEQCSYHWYIVGILFMIIMSLFNHIDIFMDGINI